MEELYIPVEEAAAILKATPRHIRNMIKKGKLRAKDIGTGEKNIWRVLKADVIK